MLSAPACSWRGRSSAATCRCLRVSVGQIAVTLAADIEITMNALSSNVQRSSRQARLPQRGAALAARHGSTLRNAVVAASAGQAAGAEHTVLQRVAVGACGVLVSFSMLVPGDKRPVYQHRMAAPLLRPRAGARARMHGLRCALGDCSPRAAPFSAVSAVLRLFCQLR